MADEIPPFDIPYYLDEARWGERPPEDLLETIHMDEELLPTPAEWEKYFVWAEEVVHLPKADIDAVRAKRPWNRGEWRAGGNALFERLTTAGVTVRLCAFLHFLRLDIPVEEIKVGAFRTKKKWTAEGRKAFRKAAVLKVPCVDGSVEWWCQPEEVAIAGCSWLRTCHIFQTYPEGEKESETRDAEVAKLRHLYEAHYAKVAASKAVIEDVIARTTESVERFRDKELAGYRDRVDVARAKDMQARVEQLEVVSELLRMTDPPAALEVEEKAKKLDGEQTAVFHAANVWYVEYQAQKAEEERLRKEEEERLRKEEEERKAEEERLRLEEEERQRQLEEARRLVEEQEREKERIAKEEEEERRRAEESAAKHAEEQRILQEEAEQRRIKEEEEAAAAKQREEELAAEIAAAKAEAAAVAATAAATEGEKAPAEEKKAEETKEEAPEQAEGKTESPAPARRGIFSIFGGASRNADATQPQEPVELSEDAQKLREDLRQSLLTRPIKPSGQLVFEVMEAVEQFTAERLALVTKHLQLDEEQVVDVLQVNQQIADRSRRRRLANAGKKKEAVTTEISQSLEASGLL